MVIHEERFDIVAQIDSGVDLNCIQEGLISTIYYEKTTEGVSSATGSKLNIRYKLSQAKICKNKICYTTSLV
ncbi:hypothetical protein, partial [Bacillus cereus]|uniref:hypothetical protein n=1 Tax=Bacillus cereus TaxID=1396 RepID=UPI0034D3DACF